MRYLRIHRGDRSRSARFEGDVRHHGAPRPRRRRPVPPTAWRRGIAACRLHRPRERQPVWRWRATGAHDSVVTSPAVEGSALAVHRRRLRHRVQRRDLQLPRPARRAGRRRLDVQDRVRHRNAARVVPGVGQAVARQGARHVRSPSGTKQNRELFLRARLFGIKPSYYTVQNGGAGPQFIFASEIKWYHRASWPTSASSTRRLSEQYLCFQRSALPETFFKGIYSWSPRTA